MKIISTKVHIVAVLNAYTKHIELIGSQDTTRDAIASDEMPEVRLRYAQ